MKKIIFIIDSLSCGGAERALIALLNEIELSKYEIDLLYFNRENKHFRNSIPKGVNIIEPDIGMEIIFSSGYNLYKYLKNYKKWLLLFFRVFFSSCSYFNQDNYFSRKVSDWQIYKRFIPNIEKKYDVAIAYLENTSTYFMLDKVNAKKYISWIRTDYKGMKGNIKSDREYFKKIDKLCVLSQNMKQNLEFIFPEYFNKIIIFPNIIDIDSILEKAKEDIKDKIFEEKQIISVGSLKKVKGYNIIIKAAKILKEKNRKYKWYILGEGKEKSNLIRDIKKLGLEENIILLGKKNNPYKYIKKSDIFVQASYREGFSTTVFEAKILKKPIVITDAEGMKEQIQNNETGLIVPKGDSEKLAEAIEKLLDFPELKDKFNKNLTIFLKKYENKNNAKVKKFENLIEGKI